MKSLIKLYIFIFFSTSIAYCVLPEPYKAVNLLPLDLHGWYSAENKKNIDQIISKLNPATVIEVGSWLGASTTDIASQLKTGAKLYAIDTWLGCEEIINSGETSRIPTLFQQFLSNCIHKNVTDTIVPVRMKSSEAAQALNITADLIYIDASHKEEDVYQDFLNWYPKLNKNGIICGDDWLWQSVRNGVKRASLELNIKVFSDGTFWYCEPKS